MVVGVACSSTNNRNEGALSIKGSGCLSQVLNADEANLSRINCLIKGKFWIVGAQGRTGLSNGGSVLRGQ